MSHVGPHLRPSDYRTRRGSLPRAPGRPGRGGMRDAASSLRRWASLRGSVFAILPSYGCTTLQPTQQSTTRIQSSTRGPVVLVLPPHTHTHTHSARTAKPQRQPRPNYAKYTTGYTCNTTPCPYVFPAFTSSTHTAFHPLSGDGEYMLALRHPCPTQRDLSPQRHPCTGVKSGVTAADPTRLWRSIDARGIDG